MNKYIKFTSIFLATAALGISFQNCSKYSSAQNTTTKSGFSSNLSEQIPTTDRIDVAWLPDKGRVFVNKNTGQVFPALGYNYSLPHNGEAHAIFNWDYYNPQTAHSDLQKMAQYNTTVVRVFIDGTKVGTEYRCESCLHTQRLNQTYMYNVADFISQARQVGIRVLITFDWVPQNYLDIYWQEPKLTVTPPTGEPYQIEDSVNGLYLSSAGLKATKLFMQDFVKNLAARNPNLLQNIFAFDLRNEIAMQLNKHPFTIHSGTIQTANGVTYDLSNLNDRQQMVDANFVSWANYVAGAIKEVDSEAMVTVSMYTMYALGYPNHYLGTSFEAPTAIANFNTLNYHDPNRYPPRPLTMSLYATNLDFLDLHIYAMGPNYDLDKELSTIQFDLINKSQTLLLIGEMGSANSQTNAVAAFPNSQQACAALTTHQNKLSQRGFSGFLHWTWNWSNQESIGANSSWWTGENLAEQDPYAIAYCLKQNTLSWFN